MNLLSFVLAQAPAQGEAPSMLPTIVMFVGVIIVFYFFMIRPQAKKQKEHQNLLNSLKKGDKVITSSGIHGTISEVEETAFIIQIAENVKIKIEKVAVSVINPGAQAQKK